MIAKQCISPFLFAALSLDFYNTTQRNLANSAPGSFTKEATYSYYAAMAVLNGLNLFWFANMIFIAMGLSTGKQPKKKKNH